MMRTTFRIDTGLVLVLAVTIILFRTAGLLPAQADPQAMPATGLQQTCDVPGTPYFTEYYGTVTLDGEPAPAGTIVEAYSPRGDLAGCEEVLTPGFYTYMRVYREDLDADPSIPGMRPDEEVTFKVDGNVAQSDPSPVVWSDDLEQHEVNLTATSAVCPYNFNDTPGVDIGDVGVITGAWRATDAGSLLAYDYNDNDIVDAGDIMTVASNMGPCP